MTDSATGNTFFGHPRGLATLFMTEMWERLSYYGMRALLVLFMTESLASQNPGLGLNTETAGAIYGLYTGFVYLLALPGGWIADRLIGQRRAVLIGGALIAAGQFSLAVASMPTFYLGLILVVLGTGLLKPNVSAIVGDLYPEGGARRDAGFSVFYMGINLGAFIGPLICGGLGQSGIDFLGIHIKPDWHYGFAAAGTGMVLGLIQYVLGGHHLGDAGHLAEAQRESRGKAARFLGLAILAVVALGVVLWLLNNAGIVHLTLQTLAVSTGGVIAGVAFVFLLSVIMFGGLNLEEKKRVVVIGVLFLGAALFWSGFEQAGSSLNLFAQRNTDLNILGWDMPASWLQSVNPLFIIALAPVFGWLWLKMGERQPSIPVKFALGLVQLGVGFLVLAWGASFTTDGNLVSPMWLVVTYFLHTCGELCLSPVGLSSMTKLSPKRYVGQMMGIWFMAAALGNLVGGLIGGQFENFSLQGLFGAVAATSIGFGLVLLAISPWVRKLIGGVK